MKRNLLLVLAAMLVIACAAIVTNAQTQKTRLAADGASVPAQQALYTDYKGVRLNMTADEVRSKLGNPVLKDEELDYYVFSENETAQIAYDKTHKVKTISVDFAGGVGAPDYRAVVGSELDTRPDGSVYKIVRHPEQGFWVSYNRTAGPIMIVTITIQKI